MAKIDRLFDELLGLAGQRLGRHDAQPVGVVGAHRSRHAAQQAHQSAAPQRQGRRRISTSATAAMQDHNKRLLR